MEKHIEKSIEILKMFEPKEDFYHLAFSGGKDSCVLIQLAKMANVKFKAYYNVTTIDPPDLIYFIRKSYPEVIFLRPKGNFFTDLINKGTPARQYRWCCEEYKEGIWLHDVKLLGIRAKESAKRSNRKMVEKCYKETDKTYINPIIEWNDKQVWDFIKAENIPYCSLYDEGFNRLGCLFCPNSSYKEKIAHKNKYPKFYEKLVKACEKYIERRIEKGNWKNTKILNGVELADWYISGLSQEEFSENKKQIKLF
jgi:phosphoadenosine phosphosulfate reductase